LAPVIQISSTAISYRHNIDQKVFKGLKIKEFTTTVFFVGFLGNVNANILQKAQPPQSNHAMRLLLKSNLLL